MTKLQQEEFECLIQPILNNNEFKELDCEIHHGITRYGHSLRVAKFSYLLTKTLHFKQYKEVTTAALLHDFFYCDELTSTGLKIAYEHPLKALENAQKYYELNPMQQNIIASHMFPLSKVLPKYKESWIVSLVDKLVATYEYAKYKATLKISIYLMFLFNMLTMQK